jgi:hypothetical protein
MSHENWNNVGARKTQCCTIRLHTSEYVAFHNGALEKVAFVLFDLETE